MPYIFRVIKVGQKADAPHIFEAVEDCILDTAKRLKAGKPVNADGLQALFDGVRIIHHMRNMDREALRDMIQFSNKEENA